MSRTTPPKTLLARAWAIDRPLTVLTVAMIPTLVLCLAGLVVDARLIGGAPAWLKPAKFAASIAIFSATLVWIFGYLEEWPRLRRRVSRISSAVFALEMLIIVVQAGRGVGSHFNTASLLDGALFAAMGAGILIQTLMTVAVAVALWRQPFADRALGWALRLGMAISIAGSFTGGLMTQPTTAQLEGARATGLMPVSGAHTVGAPDGAPGFPGTGWSTSHGDLRVPHFVGLHALQLVPLSLLVIPARARAATRSRLVVIAAASYSALFGLLLWQAVTGESVFAPSTLTATVFVGWAVASALAFALTGAFSTAPRQHGVVAI